MRNSPTNSSQDSSINTSHTAVTIKDTVISKQNSETISIKCVKCGRNVQTRGVLCTTGKHWIHYRCDYLNEDDIHKIENNTSDNTYTCKKCTEPCVSKNRIQNLMLKPPPEIECLHSARDILNEELQLDCCICNLQIDGVIINCEVCTLPCHQMCITRNKESDDTSICTNCIGNMDQRTDSSNTNEPDVVDISTPATPLNVNSTRNDDEENTTVKNTYSSNNTAVTQKENIVDPKEIKQAELRQRETKLRKREEEVKLRERMLEETKNERTWFQSHIHKLETRIKELERSNEILRKDVQLIHRTESSNPTIVHTNQDDQHVRSTPKDNNFLLNNLQDRVSNFILRQIDTQLSKMEGNFNFENEKFDKSPPKATQAPSSGQNQNVHIPQQNIAKPSVQIDTDVNFEEHNTPILPRNGHLPQYTGPFNIQRPETHHIMGQPIYFQPPPNINHPPPNINHPLKKQNIQPQPAQTMTNSNASQFFQEIEKSIDIILIQEHWLFHFELEQLKELHPKLVGVGKAVDSDNPIAASHVPRGYGGVAVLWQKSIDRYIKPLPDGSSRLQCIELTIDKPQIIISAYLPTKSSNDSYDIFLDCLDQIYEIVQKYGGTHEIIVGGDLNEDLYNPSNNSRRKHKLNDLMVECNLKTNSKGLTFINVNGIDTSEIDYFLYTDPKCEPSKRLIDLPSNVSDHHPISMRIKCNITREQQSRNSEKQKHKIRWNKVDKSRYEETISRNIGDFIESNGPLV
ncbi:unnamed protein product [Mytilus edulis]|uniref:Endonuclease/exonuclease/phosphatase domain-containing protein n=1 Tax=Mytilus edulis TaxID=6550 RepID=A0A8S3QFW0_MYTED|nr:unnamed protein product [Mytilus edulis]